MKELCLDKAHVPNPTLHQFYADSEPHWSLIELHDHRIKHGCSLQDAIEHMGPRYNIPASEDLFPAYVKVKAQLDYAVTMYYRDVDELSAMLEQATSEYRAMRDKYEELQDDVAGLPHCSCPNCGERTRTVDAYLTEGTLLQGQIHVVSGEAYICTNDDCYMPMGDED